MICNILCEKHRISHTSSDIISISFHIICNTSYHMTILEEGLPFTCLTIHNWKNCLYNMFRRRKYVFRTVSLYVRGFSNPILFGDVSVSFHSSQNGMLILTESEYKTIYICTRYEAIFLLHTTYTPPYSIV